MSSQKGNATRSRGQKYQNTTAFRNDKYGASAQIKIANAKVHDGVCQRCKEILEWKVKYNKFKSLTQPRKCVKCFQKTVKDAYHVICKPCALKLELCAKCGQKEGIVIPIPTQTEEEREDVGKKRRTGQRMEDPDELGGDFGDPESDDDSSDSFDRRSSALEGPVPDLSGENEKD